MTYSYSVVNPAGYHDVSKVKQKSPLPAAACGLVAGGAIGAFAGYKKNSVIDKHGIKDSFVKKVEEKLIGETGENAKNIYNQRQNIIKTIDKVKSPEDLRALFNANKDAAKDMCGRFKQTPEEYLKTVTTDNIKQTREYVKNWFVAEHNNRFQAVKNQIQFCWDKETKKLIKSNSVKENVYDAIIKTQKSLRKTSVIKFGVIAAAVGAALGFITGKITG